MKKSFVLGVTGSVPAYKNADFVSGSVCTGHIALVENPPRKNRKY